VNAVSDAAGEVPSATSGSTRAANGSTVSREARCGGGAVTLRLATRLRHGRPRRSTSINTERSTSINTERSVNIETGRSTSVSPESHAAVDALVSPQRSRIRLSGVISRSHTVSLPGDDAENVLVCEFVALTHLLFVVFRARPGHPRELEPLAEFATELLAGVSDGGPREQHQRLLVVDRPGLSM